MPLVSDGGATTDPIFAGAGELRALCRHMDWSSTSLGVPATWPSALRTAVQMTLASGMPNVVLWGPEFIQIYNDAYADIIRAKHPLALGRRNIDVWPELWGDNRPVYERVLSGETLYFADALYSLERSQGGQNVWDDVYLSISYSPILDDYGEAAGVLATIVETTSTVQLRALQEERKRLLDAIQLEQSRLTAVFEHAPTFLAVLQGPEHVFTRVNDAFLQIIGHRDIVGRPIAEALPEAAAQGFIDLLDAVLATGEPFIGRELPALLQRVADAPEEQRFLDLIYQPLRELDAAGVSRITGVVAHGSDVTEQVLARRAVEQANDRSKLLQALTAALAATTEPGQAEDVVVEQGARATGAATGLLALRGPPSDGIEGEWFAIVRQTGLDAIVAAPEYSYSFASPGPAAETMRSGRSIFCQSRDEIWARYPELFDVWSDIGAHSLASIPLMVSGEVAGVMSFTFNEPREFLLDEREFLAALAGQCAQALERAWLLTADRASHQRAEKALAEAEAARARAEEANQAKADFLGVISHELRTPLNAIGGYAQLLELGIHGPVTVEQARSLERIQTSQRHLLGLINSVLNYTRVEAGAVHYDLTAVPIHEVITTCEELITPQLETRGLQLDRTSCGLELSALADREKVRQIVLNLLTNSVKFTREGGHVEISCLESGNQVLLQVADTGRGIPAEQLERIFQPFVQVDAKLTRTQEGVGLGLAISRDLARAMGGDLVAQSAVGVGSIFTLTLPRAN